MAKLGCSPRKWKIVATEEALAAGLNPIQVLAGCKQRKFVEARWRAWRRLSAKGYSYASIGAASSYNHTTVMHGCDHARQTARRERWKAFRARG